MTYDERHNVDVIARFASSSKLVTMPQRLYVDVMTLSYASECCLYRAPFTHNNKRRITPHHCSDTNPCRAIVEAIRLFTISHQYNELV